jgi:hypothetical protein
LETRLGGVHHEKVAAAPSREHADLRTIMAKDFTVVEPF